MKTLYLWSMSAYNGDDKMIVPTRRPQNEPSHSVDKNPTRIASLLRDIRINGDVMVIGPVSNPSRYSSLLR